MSDFVPPKQVNKPLNIKINQEPPKEVLEQEFSIDDSIKFDDEPTRITTEDKTGKVTDVDIDDSTDTSKVEDKKVEDKKVEEKKIEDKPDEKKVEEKKEDKLPSFLKAPKSKQTEDKKEEVKITAPVINTPKNRDYSGYSAEEAAVLKQMSNEAFDFTTKILKQNRELNQNRDGAFYQNPDAYILNPEFQQLQVQAVRAQSEGDLWRTLLSKVIKNENVKLPESIDPKTGNFIFSNTETPASPELEENIRLAMQKCYGVRDQLNGQINNFGESYKRQVQQDLSALQTERESRFPWAKNPEILDYELTVNTDKGMKDIPIKQIRQDFINLFPPYLRSIPSTEVAADLIVALLISKAEIAELQNTKQTLDIKREELLRGEPSSKSKPSDDAPKIGGVSEFDMEGLPS